MASIMAMTQSGLPLLEKGVVIRSVCVHVCLVAGVRGGWGGVTCVCDCWVLTKGVIQ